MADMICHKVYEFLMSILINDRKLALVFAVLAKIITMNITSIWFLLTVKVQVACNLSRMVPGNSPVSKCLCGELILLLDSEGKSCLLYFRFQ
jgi:hypothetical protein